MAWPALALTMLASPPGVSRLLAQCTLSGPPTNFEPNPTGPAAPRPIFLSGGYNEVHALYQNGAGGPWRILMQESFGYSVLDLANPANPSVVRWHDLRRDTPPIEAIGDGQSYIRTVAASPDGQRIALGTFGPTWGTWNTLLGAPDASDGFTIRGDTSPNWSEGTAVLQVQGRYLHYAVTAAGVSVSDVTSLPGSPSTLNVSSEVTGWTAGTALKSAGNYLLYLAQDGSVQIVDASRPGPVGAITNGMPRTGLVPAHFSGRSISSATGAVDASGKLWVLVELLPSTGENSPSYGLVSFTQDVGHDFSTPMSAGPLFRIPSVPGETWAPSGGSSSLFSLNGTVFVILWGSRSSLPQQNVLYSTTTGAWPALKPTVVTNPAFTTLGQMSVLPGAGHGAWGYMSAGLYAWVLPLTCPAPLAVNATATPQTANSGDTVQFACQVAGGSGNYSYIWTGPWGTVATSQSFSQRYINSSSQNQTYQYTCAVNDSTLGIEGSGAVTVTVLPAPPQLAATVSAQSPWVLATFGATFTCSATGGRGGYVYAWLFSDGGTGAGNPVTHTFLSVGTGTATCIVTDSVLSTASAQASVDVLDPNSGGPYLLHTLNPCRVLDTRKPVDALGGPSIEAAGKPDRSFAVTSFCGIPSDAKAISANVTVTNVHAQGFVSIYRGDGARTGTTSTTCVPGKDRANMSIIKLANDGSGTIKVQNLSMGSLDLIIDVNGYFR